MCGRREACMQAGSAESRDKRQDAHCGRIDQHVNPSTRPHTAPRPHHHHHHQHNITVRNNHDLYTASSRMYNQQLSRPPTAYCKCCMQFVHSQSIIRTLHGHRRIRRMRPVGIPRSSGQPLHPPAVRHHGAIGQLGVQTAHGWRL